MNLVLLVSVVAPAGLEETAWRVHPVIKVLPARPAPMVPLASADRPAEKAPQAMLDRWVTQATSTPVFPFDFPL